MTYLASVTGAGAGAVLKGWGDGLCPTNLAGGLEKVGLWTNVGLCTGRAGAEPKLNFGNN